MKSQHDHRPIAWFTWVGRGFLVLIPLAMIVGWRFDRASQLKTLGPLQQQIETRRLVLTNMQKQLAQHRSFDGFDSVAEVVDVIENTQPDTIYAFQSQAIAAASDEVYHAAIPKVISLLGSEDHQQRQRAWQMLRHTYLGDRFTEYEQAYYDGIAEMLSRPSVPAFSTTLAWLRKERIAAPSILAALHMRMLDDQDEYAPLCAYALADLDPDAEIGPRLIQMVERRHSQWPYILHELPKYMSSEQAEEVSARANREVRKANDNRALKRQMVGGGSEFKVARP